MVTEKTLKVGQTYLYWSASKMRNEKVTYVGKRDDLVFKELKFVFRSTESLNEIWVTAPLNCISEETL